MAEENSIVDEIDNVQSSKSGNGDKHYTRFALVFESSTSKAKTLEKCKKALIEKIGSSDPWDVIKYVLGD